MIDDIAREVAISRYGLAECVHVPIAAVDEAAISTYVGEVRTVLSGGSFRKALLVCARTPAPRDPRFPIWDVEGCNMLHRPMQVWVDVPTPDIGGPIAPPFPTKNLATASSATR